MRRQDETCTGAPRFPGSHARALSKQGSKKISFSFFLAELQSWGDLPLNQPPPPPAPVTPEGEDWEGFLISILS